jgi:hypothetical protein
VRVLLRLGANPAAKNAFGKTAYEIAAVLADQILPEGVGGSSGSGSGFRSATSLSGSYSNLLGLVPAEAGAAGRLAGNPAALLFDRLLGPTLVDWDAVASILHASAKATNQPKQLAVAAGAKATMSTAAGSQQQQQPSPAAVAAVAVKATQ